MASSKTLAEFFNPAKRLKSVPSPETLIPKSSISCNSSPSNASSDPDNLTTYQKSRIEINKYSALAKRNLRICTERVSKSKAEGTEYVKLEELLVEDSWVEVLPGELQKPYAKNLCRFVEREGVLLLNTVLTVRNHQANSHAKKGWELFTDAVIRTISQRKSGVVFLLWGNSAQEKSRLIDEAKHHILRAAHPSGLSANRGFFGCRHFSQTNKILEGKGHVPIDWQL
ncbi:hypothetical protein MRB53_000285 [Persea americana]|uniref:Uncharacterized protein n=1 Tax=Persea americana TaxID=3435 RepID=A0ACC2MNF8_PERAE|nr:hypothetical protein MRB53_000285 [Persea americana]